MSEPKKHHFIPQFLLAEWAVNDGKLWRFTRPYGSKIARKLVAPAEIGYERLLYTTPGIPAEYAQQFEAKFLSPLDSRAAQAHKMLLRDEPIVWTQPLRSDWTRFLSSLLFRTPENLADYKQAIGLLLSRDTPELRAAYLREKPDDWPETFHEAMATIAPDWAEVVAMEILRRLIDNRERGEKINGMVWTTGEMKGGSEFFITDAPMQHTRPIIAKGGYIVMPISPTRMFLATSPGDDETAEMFKNIDSNDLVRQVNEVLVSRASTFVGATNLDQLSFVERHFATEPHDTIIKGVIRQYREAGF